MFVPASVAVFKAGAAAILCTYAAVETYCRIPQYVLFGSLPQPLPDFNEKDLVVIFPGAGWGGSEHSRFGTIHQTSR